jgi:hypothetical protein
MKKIIIGLIALSSLSVFAEHKWKFIKLEKYAYCNAQIDGDYKTGTIIMKKGDSLNSESTVMHFPLRGDGDTNGLVLILDGMREQGTCPKN